MHLLFSPSRARGGGITDNPLSTRLLRNNPRRALIEFSIVASERITVLCHIDAGPNGKTGPSVVGGKWHKKVEY